MRAAGKGRSHRRLLQRQDGDGGGELERGRRLRHARARGRAPYGPAHAGQSYLHRPQHAWRRRNDRHQFSLQQRRQGRQRDRARSEQHAVRAAVRHQGGALRPRQVQLAGLAELGDRHGAHLARGAGEFGAELKAREVAVGVSGANSTPAFFTRLLNATLGTKMKPVNGYPGQNDVLLAMERGELDGHPSAFFSSVRSTRPAWLRDKTAKAIVQYGPEKLAELLDVPFAPDLVASDDDRLVMEAAFAPLALGRPFLVPPGIPVERLAALREAFAATMADPDFLAEGEKMGLGLNAPRTGAQIQAVMERAYQSPPRVIDRLRQLNVP